MNSPASCKFKVQPQNEWNKSEIEMEKTKEKDSRFYGSLHFSVRGLCVCMCFVIILYLIQFYGFYSTYKTYHFSGFAV